MRPPVPAGDLNGVLNSAFGFSSFRPNQEEVCRAAIEGRDVPPVMPTGSGKLLCYQLPGITRGGTTLVTRSHRVFWAHLRSLRVDSSPPSTTFRVTGVTSSRARSVILKRA